MYLYIVDIRTANEKITCINKTYNKILFPSVPNALSNHQHIAFSHNANEKPTPQENNSEVLKALLDQECPLSGVAGMAELQEDRTIESMNKPHHIYICLPYIFLFFYSCLVNIFTIYQINNAILRVHFVLLFQPHYHNIRFKETCGL